MMSSVPSKGDSNSSVDFSVSKVNRISPLRTNSPATLCHCTIDPSVMVRPTFGINTSIGGARNPIASNLARIFFAHLAHQVGQPATMVEVFDQTLHAHGFALPA